VNRTRLVEVHIDGEVGQFEHFRRGECAHGNPAVRGCVGAWVRGRVGAWVRGCARNAQCARVR